MTRKTKIILICAVLVLLGVVYLKFWKEAGLFTNKASTDISTDSLLTYNNGVLGVSFKYPASWPVPTQFPGVESSDGLGDFGSGKFLWQIKMGNALPGFCEGSSCSPFLLEAYSPFQPDQFIKKLKSDELIKIHQDTKLGNFKVVVYSEGGICGDRNALVFTPKQTWRLYARCGDDNPDSIAVFDNILSSLNEYTGDEVQPQATRDGFDESTYSYKGATLKVASVKDGGASMMGKVSLQTNQKTKVLADNVMLGEGAPEIMASSNPDIARFFLAFGDLGYVTVTEYYVNVQTGELQSINMDNRWLIKITDAQKRQQTIEMLFSESCDAKLGIEKSKPISIKGLTLNFKLAYEFTTPKKITCLPPSDGFGPITEPGLEFRFIGMNKDQSKVYFELVATDYPEYTTEFWKAAFVLDLKSGVISDSIVIEDLL